MDFGAWLRGARRYLSLHSTVRHLAIKRQSIVQVDLPSRVNDSTRNGDSWFTLIKFPSQHFHSHLLLHWTIPFAFFEVFNVFGLHKYWSERFLRQKNQFLATAIFSQSRSVLLRNTAELHSVESSLNVIRDVLITFPV